MDTVVGIYLSVFSFLLLFFSSHDTEIILKIKDRLRQGQKILLLHRPKLTYQQTLKTLLKQPTNTRSTLKACRLSFSGRAYKVKTKQKIFFSGCLDELTFYMRLSLTTIPVKFRWNIRLKVSIFYFNPSRPTYLTFPSFHPLRKEVQHIRGATHS